MYDMYPWDHSGPGGRTPEHPGNPRPRADSRPSPRTPEAAGAQAVQVALDRRDNGGAVAGAAGQPTAGPTRQ